jgi:hypothetical protein
MRGRLPSGPDYVAKLPGSEEARRRLQVILQTLAGDMRVQQACSELAIGMARFHQLRRDALQGAMAQLELRPAGRPAQAPEDPRVAEMEGQIQELKLELEAARTREEIALVLPGLHAEPAREDRPGKKPSRRRTSRRRPQARQKQEQQTKQGPES